MKAILFFLVGLFPLILLGQEAELKKAVEEGLVLDYYYQANFKKIQKEEDIERWLNQNNYVPLKYQYGGKSKFGGYQKGIVGVAFITQDVARKQEERKEKDALKAKLAGKVVINTQQDLDSFSEKYGDPTRIEGELILKGDITNLKGLSNVKYINKFGLVGTKLVDLSGLQLESTGSLNIESNDYLVSLKGIENFYRCKNFAIKDNPKLKDISAISKLLLVEQTFTITSNYELSHCSIVFDISASRYNIGGNKKGCDYPFEIKPENYPIAVRPAFYKLQLGDKVYAIQFVSKDIICYRTFPERDFAITDMYVHFNKHNEWEIHEDKTYAKYTIEDNKVKIKTAGNVYAFAIKALDKSLTNEGILSKPYFDSDLNGCVYGDCTNGYGILMNECHKRGKNSWIIQGNFKNGLTNGSAKYYSWDYTFWSHEGMFKEGKRHGRGIERHDAYLKGTTRGYWVNNVYQKPNRSRSNSSIDNCGCNIERIKDEGWFFENSYQTVTFENNYTADIKFENGKWQVINLFFNDTFDSYEELKSKIISDCKFYNCKD